LIVFVLASTEGIAAITAGATLVAALGLALITVYTTKRRLSEAGARQEENLAGEAERQAATLVHGRELADLADLRALLDEAAVALNRAREGLDELKVGLDEHGRVLPSEIKDKVAECGRQLLDLAARLQVRLGADDPIAVHFGEANMAMLTSWRQVVFLIDDTAERIAARKKALQDARDAFAVSTDAFLRAAVERAGTVTIRGDMRNALPR
jgi:hypothetical protein